MLPTVVWVIVSKDYEGVPRGFDHTTGCLYLTEGDANTDHEKLGKCIKDYFSVEACVIMGKSHYDQLR